MKPLADYFQDPEAMATPMLVGLIDEFGTELFDWEPETLNLEIQREFKVEVPDDNRDKIWALITAITTDTFMSSFEAFTHICNSLMGAGASFRVYDPATVQEMAWAVTEVTLIHPFEKGETFNAEILTYMFERLRLESFSRPPRVLAQWVPDLDDSERVGESAELDQFDADAFWSGQQKKRLEVEKFVGESLLKVMQDLASLPLKEADPKAIQEILQRAETTLGAQSRTIQQVAGSVPTTPNL